MTNLVVYNNWLEAGCNKSWAEYNTVNHRAMLQARSIRNQLKSLAHRINRRKVDRFLREDHVYKYFKKKTDRKDRDRRHRFSTAELISLCMSSSFFHNSARRMFNENEDYLMLQNSAIVNMDEFSSFAIRSNYPEYIIFTELSGKEYARGIIRSICKIEKRWIEGYLQKVESVKSGEFERRVMEMFGQHRFKKDTKKKVLKLTLGDEKLQKINDARAAQDKNNVSKTESSSEVLLKKRSKAELKAEKIRLAKERFAQRKGLRKEIKAKEKRLKR
jgi:hypothetical protein